MLTLPSHYLLPFYLKDQLRRLRKQQQVMRERGGVTGSSMPGMKSLGLSNKVNRHRRHKTLTEALIKMRCGACGQTGNKKFCNMHTICYFVSFIVQFR